MWCLTRWRDKTGYLIKYETNIFVTFLHSLHSYYFSVQLHTHSPGCGPLNTAVRNSISFSIPKTISAIIITDKFFFKDLAKTLKNLEGHFNSFYQLINPSQIISRFSNFLIFFSLFSFTSSSPSLCVGVQYYYSLFYWLSLPGLDNCDKMIKHFFIAILGELTDITSDLKCQTLQISICEYFTLLHLYKMDNPQLIQSKMDYPALNGGVNF